MKIFLVIFDTLRKDHTGKTYGNDWIVTPNFDAFAKESIVFDKAIPECCPTVPARRSIHTGIRTFPFNHPRPKLRTDDVQSMAGWNPIPPHQKHIGEYMKGNAFTTSFITDVYHQFKPNNNYHLGFDEWEFIRGQEIDKWRAKMRGKRKKFHQFLRDYMVESRTERGAGLYQKNTLQMYFRNVQDRKVEEEYFPPRVFNRALQFVEDTKRVKNTFCLIDLYDPHEPWDPPEKFLNLYVDPNYDGRKVIHPIYSKNLNYLTEGELKYMRASYAGEISLCDHWFGYFLNQLKNMEFYDDSLIILMSDHGASIGDHNATGKMPMFMYPELVDIPLMIKPPGGVSGPKRIRKSYVSIHDILPTLFGFIGAQKPEVFEGVDLSIFANNDDQLLEKRDYITCGMSVCTLYKDDRYALITSNDRSHQKLFDLSKDPDWNDNIAENNPDICNELFKKIEEDAKGDLLFKEEEAKVDELKDFISPKFFKKED